MQKVVRTSNNVRAKSAEFYTNKALDHFNHGDIENAMKYAINATEINPEEERALNLIGVIYKQKNDLIRAARYFESAILADNKNPNYYYNLGIIRKESGDTKGALESQLSALALSNHNTLYLNETGLIYINLNLPLKAREVLDQAYEIDPENISTCINLSHLYVILGDIRKSIDYSNKAIAIDPDRPESYNNLGKALLSANFHEQGIECIKQAYLKGSENSARIHQSILMNMLYPDCYTPETVFSEHEKWVAAHLKKDIPKSEYPQIRRNKTKKLHIGFISPDFKDHSIAYFLIPLLESINHKNFEIYCYSTSNKADKVTERFKCLTDIWHNLTEKTDETSVKIIQEDKIDILIELSGHSLGSRMGILNRKPAPVQISYLGYPFSTGLSNIDYRITDEYSDPGDTTAHLHTEKLVKISPSFLCYKPDTNVSIARILPVEKNSFITFGSFNKFCKLSNKTIELWSKILLSVENSRILLKNSQPIPDLLRDHLLSSFEKYGINPDRVVLHHAINDKSEHIAYYNNIDICLDPLPYNGTTTTFEAIYMGVPVITLSGKSHYSRVSTSILSNLNLHNLVANSSDDYVNIATKLSDNITELKSYRQSLRKKLLSSPLTDSTKFALRFEQLLQQSWNNFCEKEAYNLQKPP
ncbi:MAG: hypothetical protein OEX07_08165 [Gammaproteobacteria bacterium]|nr:hypothetical protein [Gammaproteobacteria bacterium]